MDLAFFVQRLGLSMGSTLHITAHVAVVLGVGILYLPDYYVRSQLKQMLRSITTCLCTYAIFTYVYT